MAEFELKDLLLSRQLDFQQVIKLLSPYGFKEIKKADTNLQLIADEPRAKQLFSETLKEFLECFSRSPDPDQALNYFERFARATVSKIQFFSYLKGSPYTLEILARLFGSSPFFSEILIRNPTYLYWLTDPDTIEKDKPKADLDQEVTNLLRNLKNRDRKMEVLCLIKRRELLRIGARDLLKKASLEQTTKAISILAEILIQKVYEICHESLQGRYGAPIHKNRVPFTVLGMGKLGGGELNFSSDVDLMFLYTTGEGRTSGNRDRTPGSRISNMEYFTRLSQEITSALSNPTDEGYLYRVDLRLRPEGRAGQIAYSLKGYKHYYHSRGETWERLALLKAWPVAGNHRLGRQFLRAISPFVYSRPFTLSHLKEVKNLKERINRKMMARGEGKSNVKLGIGGIREIEFIIQSFQIALGRRIPHVRERNSLKVLRRLFRLKLLPQEAYTHLREAYIFLRNVEHRLQMVHEFQTHRLPDHPQELRLCALRLGYRDKPDVSAADQLMSDFRLHTERVHALFEDLLDKPKKFPKLFSRLTKTGPIASHQGRKKTRSNPPPI